MKSFVFAAGVAVVLALPGGARAEAGLDDLFKREQIRLNAVPPRRLNGFLSFLRRSPKASQQPMSYTRDWVDAQPAATGDANFACLAEALYFEARGETVQGQFAVAEVIMNRVASAQFPNSLCSVINQGTGRRFRCQFTYTCDGRAEVVSEQKAYARVAKVARAVIDGTEVNLTDGATYYHTTAVQPRWSRQFTKTARIGVHLFYRDERYRIASSE